MLSDDPDTIGWVENARDPETGAMNISVLSAERIQEASTAWLWILAALLLAMTSKFSGQKKRNTKRYE
jgi:hypothetical protein